MSSAVFKIPLTNATEIWTLLRDEIALFVTFRPFHKGYPLINPQWHALQKLNTCRNSLFFIGKIAWWSLAQAFNNSVTNLQKKALQSSHKQRVGVTLTLQIDSILVENQACRPSGTLETAESIGRRDAACLETVWRGWEFRDKLGQMFKPQSQQVESHASS